MLRAVEAAFLRHDPELAAERARADPQYALDLAATATGAAEPEKAARATGQGPAGQGPAIHVHLHTDATTDATTGVARVDRLGPRSSTSTSTSP